MFYYIFLISKNKEARSEKRTKPPIFHFLTINGRQNKVAQVSFQILLADIKSRSAKVKSMLCLLYLPSYNKRNPMLKFEFESPCTFIGKEYNVPTGLPVLVYTFTPFEQCTPWFYPVLVNCRVSRNKSFYVQQQIMTTPREVIIITNERTPVATTI